jgi:hypothetical protein
MDASLSFSLIRCSANRERVSDVAQGRRCATSCPLRSKQWIARIRSLKLLRRKSLRNRARERDPVRIRTKVLKSFGFSHLASQSRVSDLNQSVGIAPSDNFDMEWKPIATAPFDRDLELAVIDCRMLLCFHVAVFSTVGSTQRRKRGSMVCDRRTGESGCDRLKTRFFCYFFPASHLASPTWLLPQRAIAQCVAASAHPAR